MRTYTLALSIVVHVLVLGVLVVSPIIANDSLPDPHRPVRWFEVMLTIPTIPPPRGRAVSPGPARVNTTAVPLDAPSGITPEPALEAFERGGPEGLPGGDPRGVEGGMWTEALPPPPPPEPPQPKRPVPVGGSIREPQRIHYVAPVYLPIAQSAGVQGTVILEAEIGEDGRVRNVRVLRSVRLLDSAAVDAVKQWRFTPTLLNGVPVPVVMTVTVSFMLQR